MRYSFKERPYGIFLIIALIFGRLVYGLTMFVLTFIKGFSGYSIAAIVISGVCALLMGYFFLSDLIKFLKERNQKKDDSKRN